MSSPDISPQQERENPDPQERTNPVPWPMFGLAALLVGFGVVYILQEDIQTPAVWGDGRSAAELAGGTKTTGAKVDGAALFASLCVACHQATGQGLPGVFPPLAGSEWVIGNEATAAAILLHGIHGPLTVKGTVYNGVMPAFGGQLNDEQIAAVLTHIRSQWGNAAVPVTAETVAAAREAHKARTAPFEGDKGLPSHD